ncbi:MAG: (d)CMP kinase [Rhizobiaceae bacterium]|nr:(d)CMP kinase [Rhizobiaceae bacterium]
MFIIAIDGPAASGKGTLGRRLSQELALPHLDTGLTYRAVAHELLRGDLPLDDESVAVEAALRVDLAKLDRATLSDHAVGNAASKVAAMPAVRRTLVELQRDFAASPPGAVLDGRDIGTVVCPDADVKLYVTASPEERAKRRWKEMQDKGQDADYQEILDDIAARDARDMGREDSPLRPADDAHLLDTSQMDIETAFQRAMTFVEMVKSR